MQYLLTEEEYQRLLGNRKKAAEADRERLQAFCTLVANEMPVYLDWMDRIEIWGCILNDRTNKELKQPGYCDDCPSREMCPHPSKRWSK